MFNEILELQKGAGGLSEGFQSSSGFHKAMAEHHDAMAKEHYSHAVVKAHHEAMENEDVHKAYFGKVADHHKAMAERHTKAAQGHKDEAERLDAAAKAMRDTGGPCSGSRGEGGTGDRGRRFAGRRQND